MATIVSLELRHVVGNTSYWELLAYRGRDSSDQVAPEKLLMAKGLRVPLVDEIDERDRSLHVEAKGPNVAGRDMFNRLATCLFRTPVFVKTYYNTPNDSRWRTILAFENVQDSESEHYDAPAIIRPLSFGCFGLFVFGTLVTDDAGDDTRKMPWHEHTAGIPYDVGSPRLQALRVHFDEDVRAARAAKDAEQTAKRAKEDADAVASSRSQTS